MFDIYNVEVVPYPNVLPKTLVEASYSGKKPFKETGEGFKDFIVFETLKTVAAQHGSQGAFVTSNKKDFCGPNGELHSDLQSQVQQEITVFDNIHDFNIGVLTPQLEVLDDIAERIRSGTFSGFDLDATLTACFITELCDKYRRVEVPGILVEDTTVSSVYTPSTRSLTVNRLGEGKLLLGLIGYVELELSGFVPKIELFALSKEDMENISIDDHDWNDYVASASTTVEFNFSMTAIFDESKNQIESVSIDLEPADED
jgi:hypothetical protein